MSWQEELRALDEELASGRLSADEYRVRRDHVLSAAVYEDSSSSSAPAAPSPFPAMPPAQTSQTDTNAVGHSGDESTQIISPVSSPQHSQNQPPQAQPPQNPASDEADKTQVVSGPDLSAERTQAVPPVSIPSWQNQQWQHNPAGGDPNETQVVSGASQPSGGYAYPGPQSGPQPIYPQSPQWMGEQQGQQPWEQPEFAPQGSQHPEWIRQGPEYDDDGGGEDGRRRLLFILLAAIVVVGIGIGAFLLFGGNDDNANNAQPQPTTSTSAPSSTAVDPNAPLIDRIPQPPGEQDTNNGVVDAARLVSLQAMDQGSADALAANGVTGIAWRGSTKTADENGPHPDKIAIVAAAFPDQAKAQAAAQAISAHQDGLGYINEKNPFPNMPAEIIFHKELSPTKITYYGLWVSESTIVQVRVFQDPLQDEAAMSGNYQRQVLAALKNFPISQ